MDFIKVSLLLALFVRLFVSFTCSVFVFVFVILYQDGSTTAPPPDVIPNKKLMVADRVRPNLTPSSHYYVVAPGLWDYLAVR